jgi:signal transduction histidine kinase
MDSGLQQQDAIERHRYLEVLHQFTMSQASLTSVDDICWNIAKTAIGDLGFVDCVVYLINDEGDRLIQRAAHGEKNPSEREILDPIEIPMGSGIVGSVAKTGELQLVNDTRSDPRYILDDDFRCSELAVPILHEGRVVGVLDSEHPEANFYSEEDVKLFTTIAALASTRLDTALALERLESQALELREAREAAEAASRAKSQFIASVSHDMRTPLTAIIGYAHLLEEGAGSADERSDWLSAVVANSEYMKAMIGNVLDMAAIESGQLQVEADSIDIREWTEKLRQLIGRRVIDRGLSLSFHVESGTPEMWVADRAKLDELAMNLLTNAIKYTMEGSISVTVSVSARDSVDWLRIVVDDTGIGMRPSVLDRIFQPFTRVHDMSSHSTIEGTGLGLTVVKSFIDLMGGDIEMNSTFGEGTQATVMLPPARPEPNADVGTTTLAANSTEPPSHPSPTELLKGVNLLICEDSETVSMLLRVMLERAGAVVTTAADGEEGLTQFTQHSNELDLVITDMQMPKLDGYELMRRIRATGWSGHIIALTAFAASEDEDKCRAAGCSHYLTKPINPASFAGSIAAILASEAV